MQVPSPRTVVPAEVSTEIRIWPVDRLVGYARNPRKNNAAVDRMCGSIREFGFKIPCLVRSDGEVIDGHLRLKAASCNSPMRCTDCSSATFRRSTSAIQRVGRRDLGQMIDIRCRVLVAQELERRLTSVANGSGTPKRFEGTLEELLTVYRQMTLEADEKEDPRGNAAA